jgi:hypothetical protein
MFQAKFVELIMRGRFKLPQNATFLSAAIELNVTIEHQLLSDCQKNLSSQFSCMLESIK